LDLFDLAAKITLDSSEYESGLDSASDKASGFGGKLKTALKVGTGAVTAVTGATAAMTTAFVKATGSVASYGDDIDKMSQKLGMSAESYQEWDAIMQHAGTSIDSMQRGMTTLSNAVENGNEAFETLGISLEDAASMSQEELFAATITALQGMESGTERTVLAQKLLGGSAKELGALLNTSAEETEEMRQRVHELGGVMSDEAVKASARYEDSLQDMQTAFSGLSRSMITEFLPGVTTVMDGLTEIFAGDSDSGLALVSDGIDNLLAQITDKLPEFMEVGLGIIESLASAIIDNLPELADVAIDVIKSLALGIIDNLPEIFSVATEILFALIDGIVDALPELIPAAVDVILTIVNTLTDPDNIGELINAAIAIIMALANGLIQALPRLIEAAPRIVRNLVQAIIENVPLMIHSAGELIGGLVSGIISMLPEIGSAAWDILTEIGNVFMDLPFMALSWGADLIDGFIDGILGAVSRLWNTVKDIAGGIKNFLGFSEPKEGPLSNFHTYAPDMMELFAKGIKDNEHLVTDQLSDSFDFENQLTQSVKGGATSGGASSNDPITIIVQSVLDGKVIGETAYKYSRQKARAYG